MNDSDADRQLEADRQRAEGLRECLSLLDGLRLMLFGSPVERDFPGKTARPNVCEELTFLRSIRGGLDAAEHHLQVAADLLCGGDDQ